MPPDANAFDWWIAALVVMMSGLTFYWVTVTLIRAVRFVQRLVWSVLESRGSSPADDDDDECAECADWEAWESECHQGFRDHRIKRMIRELETMSRSEE